MRRAGLIDVTGRAAILGWLAFSIAFAMKLDGDMFQRMGAAGVAIAVAYFAFVRHAQPYPFGLHERLYWLTRTLDLHRRGLNTALSNSTVIAAVWKRQCEERGEEVPQPISELAAVLEHAVDVSEQEKAFSVSDAEKSFRETVNNSNSADELVSSVKFRSDTVQMVVVVVATLQWGFGDLLFPKICEAAC